MSWRVEVQRPAEKELAKLSSQARERIVRVLREMAEDPFPVGYRIRVGRYRVLYRVDSVARLVTVGAIGHRKDVYR